MRYHLFAIDFIIIIIYKLYIYLSKIAIDFISVVYSGSETRYFICRAHTYQINSILKINTATSAYVTTLNNKDFIKIITVWIKT
jgi:hypothetical protein